MPAEKEDGRELYAAAGWRSGVGAFSAGQDDVAQPRSDTTAPITISMIRPYSGSVCVRRVTKG